MKRVPLLTLQRTPTRVVSLLKIGSLFICGYASAFSEFGVGLQSGYVTLEERTTAGIRNRVGSNLGVGGNLFYSITTDRADMNRLRFSAVGLTATLIGPTGATLSQSRTNPWSGSVDFQMDTQRFTLGLGVLGAGSPVIHRTTGNLIQIEHPFQVLGRGELSYRLVVLERRALKIGAYPIYGAPSVLAPSGNRINASYGGEAKVELIFRGETQFILHGIWDNVFLRTVHGSGNQTGLRFGLTISFPGRFGLRPPKDELDSD